MFEEKATEIIKFILDLGVEIKDEHIQLLKEKIRLELQLAYTDGKIKANRDSLELVRQLRSELENKKRK